MTTKPGGPLHVPTRRARRTVRLNANVDVDVHRELKVAAAEEGRSMTELLEEAVLAYLDRRRTGGA